jgi:PAS domain S-box-containing protein
MPSAATASLLRDSAMKKKLGLKALLWLMSAAGVVGMLVISLFFLSVFHASQLASKENEVRERVEMALSLVDEYHAREQRGELTHADAQARALAAVRHMRTGDADYLWVNDTAHVMLMHPYMPELEGKQLVDFKDSNGKNIIAAFVQAATAAGEGGYVPYTWPKPGASLPQPKLSYVKLFPSWQWIIGSGVYVDDVEAAFRQQLWVIALIVGGMGLLSALLAYRLRHLVLDRVGGDMADAVNIATRLAGGKFDTLIDLSAAVPRRGEVGRAGWLGGWRHYFSARRLAEIENRRLGEALKQSHEAIALVDADLHYSYVNPAYCRLFGYRQEEVVGQSVRLLEVAEDKEHSPDETVQIATRSGLFHGEVLRRAKDGRPIPVLVNIAPVFDEHRIVSGYVATMTDLSEIKRVTEQLRKNEEKFHAIFDQTFQFIGILKPDGCVLDTNRSSLDALGIELDEVLGKPFWETPWWRASGEQCEQLRAAVARAAQGDFVRFEVANMLGDGLLRYLDFSLKPVYDSHGAIELLVAEGRDITERKLAEEEARTAVREISRINSQLRALNSKLEQAQNQILQSEKMASIGVLAAGVAHEINNPIGFVSSNLGTLGDYVEDLLELLNVYEYGETLLRQSDAPEAAALIGQLEALKERIDLQFMREDVVGLLSESHEGITRVKNIVQSLKDFAHVSREDSWAAADLHAGIESTLQVVWNELKYKCQVVKEFGQLPPVECLLPQLNQVFMNLLVNAAQAIEEKGIVTIRTGVRDDWVWIEIADTGKGIPAEQLKQIFDPFFTTKPVGKGTGLGLSVSYSIVQKHQGRIEVDSEVGKGSTFRVWLPVSQQAVAEVA